MNMVKFEEIENKIIELRGQKVILDNKGYVFELDKVELEDLQWKFSTAKFSNMQDDDQRQNLLQKSGGIIAEILDDNIVSKEKETTIELNFAVLKFKHTIRKSVKNGN